MNDLKCHASLYESLSLYFSKRVSTPAVNPMSPHARVSHQSHTYEWFDVSHTGYVTNMNALREVGGWGRVPFSKKLMSPTPRRKWYLTTGRRAHYMVLDPIPQSLPVHFFGSRPQPPTSPRYSASILRIQWLPHQSHTYEWLEVSHTGYVTNMNALLGLNFANTMVAYHTKVTHMTDSMCHILDMSPTSPRYSASILRIQWLPQSAT